MTPTTATTATKTAPNRRLRTGALVVAAVGLLAGVGGGLAYNSSYRTRINAGSAFVVTGADLTTYADLAAGAHQILVPLENDSPNAVKVTGVSVVDAPTILWDGNQITIQSGDTAYLTVTTPANCPAVVHPASSPKRARVQVGVHTVDGKRHAINLGYEGVLAYAVQECGPPQSASGS